uniref:cilia- and flagella-associated protein 61 n=1 Tax=Solea senegalensis TaxID=28829 RepID=UPI001CD86D00|nr:cilia- and flagella-associated protein 61 [Solea senegalensis]
MKNMMSSETVNHVSVRRSESADAENINNLITNTTVQVFGRVNVLQLLEKANLAVTVADDSDSVVAHASFLDYPPADLVDPAHCELFLQKHFTAGNCCTTLNTLFLHLFVAQPEFAAESLKEIMRVVFNAVSELDNVCLISSNIGDLEPTLKDTFEPLKCLSDTEPQSSVFVCHRNQLCPRIHVRPARLEDHDDVMSLFDQQRRLLSVFGRPDSLTEVIEVQDEDNLSAVCEVNAVIVGFIRLTADVHLKELRDSFDLHDFNGFFKQQRKKPEEEAAASRPWEKHRNVFWIQFFVIDSKYETRSADVLPYVFKHFPDLDLCVITAPTLCPDFQLRQSFLRMRRRTDNSLPYELYIFHRDGLRPVEVRPAVAADRAAVSDLIQGLTLSESLLQDLDWFYQSRCDPDGVQLQAFVAQVDGDVVGAVVIADEQDVEYVRARYNIENFVYFSHHRYEEHARLRHFVLRPSFQHFSRHLFKETLRLSHRSCLYLRIHPLHHSHENSCVHHLDFVLNCGVPVRPRRQIIYPLEEVGSVGPCRRITEEQEAYALCLLSRKLTLEPKVNVNARVVVVGASDTGLSFLEVLCLCPHLSFNNLTLISTHGFPGDRNHDDRDDVAFLSTSHAYSGRDLALLPLRCRVAVVTDKMVAIDRKSKYVVVRGGEKKVPYDFLVICTGLQYQVPRPTGRPQTPPPRRRQTAPAPSNLLTLNDLHDCTAARHWLRANFVEQEGDAVVYGNNVDVYTTVETLLSLGVRGSRVHVVLPPPEPGAACFSDPSVEEGVAAALEKNQVQVHRRCLLTQMDRGGHEDHLTSVSFTTDAGTLRLLCGVFINLSSRGVDGDAFRSISGSFLVFDGRLVINAAFQTSDPAIFAAGPVTKFSRRYHADEWSHASFNSKEVGERLAAEMLTLLDPTQEPRDEAASDLDQDRLVPLYKRAKIQATVATMLLLFTERPRLQHRLHKHRHTHTHT